MDAKRAISYAMIELLHNYRADDISVQMILEEAQVSRATFYRYYRDKFEVMVWLYKNYLEGNGKRRIVADYEKDLANAFVFLKENRTYFQKVLTTSRDNVLEQYLVEFAVNYYTTMYTDTYQQPIAEKDRIQIYFSAYGATKVTLDWIYGGCKEDTAELANAIAEMVPPLLRADVKATQA